MPITLYRRNVIPAFLVHLDLIRVSEANIGATEDEIASIRPFVTGESCISEKDPPDSMTLAWRILTFDEMTKLVERNRSRLNATIGFTIYDWYLSDVTRIMRGNGSANYRRISECDDLDLKTIGSLAAPVSIIPFLRYARETAQDKRFYPTRAEEAKIKETEQRLFAELKLKAKQRKLKPAHKPYRKSREYSTRPKVKSQVLADHNSKCLFSGVSSLSASLAIHHVIPYRVVELLQLPKELLTEAFNLVPICSDLNSAKSAILSKKDVELYLERFAEPAHPNHRIVKYLELIRKIQRFSESNKS